MVTVYVEAVPGRTFAGALDWPGWCRGGRGEEAALQALCEYGPRYARAVRGTRLGFAAPASPSDFTIIERLEGDAGTGFGVPSIAPTQDDMPVDDRELGRLTTVLQASWSAFDRAAAAASSTTLRKGPRGGGRPLDAILLHVLQSEGGYLVRLGAKGRTGRADGGATDMAAVRRDVLEALAAAPRRGPAPPGPRGGKRWTIRYFVRRSAWHALDHAWEIEDRAG